MQQFLSNPFYSLETHSIRTFASKFSGLNNWLFPKLMGNSEASCIHLQVGNVLDLAALYEAVLLGIFRTQYFEDLNQAEERFFRGLNNGNLVYDAKQNEIRVFLHKEGTRLIFAPYPRNKNHTFYEVNENRINDLLLLAGQNENTHYTRNTNTYLEAYAKFVKSFLHEDRILSTFQNRTVIISNLNWVNQLAELHYLPIQVGSSKRYLPIQPLIEIYNDKEEAFQNIRDNKADLVYVGNDMESIINDATNYQGDGKINKLIFITSCHISKDYGFKKWAWTREETLVLEGKQLGDFKSEFLASQELQTFRDSFTVLSNELIEKGCDSVQIRGLINWILSGYANHAFINRDDILQRQTKQINDDDEGVLSALLSEARIYDTLPVKQRIIGLITDFRFMSGKLAFIEKATRNESFKETIIVTPKWQAKLLKVYFSNSPRVKIITNTELRSILRQPPDEYLADGILFKKKRQIIIPHVSLDYQHTDGPLRYYQLYQLARQMGHVTLLFYEGIENNRARLFEVCDEREHQYRCTHPDRQFFVPEYSFECYKANNQSENEIIGSEKLIDIIEEAITQLEPIADYQTKLNDYFSTYFGVWKNVKRLPKLRTYSDEAGETIEAKTAKTLVSKVKYRLWFDADNYEDWGENDLIGIKTPNAEWKAGRVHELTAGDTILDFSITLDNAWEPLKTIPEAAESIEAVKWASREWREWLKHSFQNYLHRFKCTEDTALQRLCEKLSVSVDKVSVKRWMKDRQTEYFFPRSIDDLEKVLDLRIRQTLLDQQPEMQEKAQRIRASRGRSAGFREVITKLKIELTHWKLQGQKGDILGRMAEHFVTELTQCEAPRRISKIEKPLLEKIRLWNKSAIQGIISLL